MGIELLVVALLVFMLIAALVAVETSDLLSAVISIGAAGFALSAIDLLVGAPDLAITQLVFEVIALVLLLCVVLTRRDTSVTQPRDALRTGVALLACGVVLVIVFFAVGGTDGRGALPPFGDPVLNHGPGAVVSPGVSAEYLARGARETGAANAVMAVLLDYRAYDTLGEATIIFVSILGAYAILRRVGRRAAARKEEAAP
ncbi:MAG: DUF4040 domain-containing protein [Planctomycetes bacterium]|nr:DUF4040 domain-containing protein [Planctomycetota bacterium]